MASNISAESALRKLYKTLENEPSVHALWLEGSRAEDQDDDYSDYDVWIDVDDGSEQIVLDLAEATFQSFGKLDLRFELPITHPQLRHITYHIKGTNKFHRIEINIQAHSRQYRFISGVDVIKVIFDKDDTIQYRQALDNQAELQSRAKFLRQKFDSGFVWIERELSRNNYLEAYAAYEYWLLKPLVELARIKYAPAKHEYDLKHISRDLPAELLHDVEELYKNQSLEDVLRHMILARSVCEKLS